MRSKYDLQLSKRLRQVKILMKRTQSGLVPCYDSDYEALKKIKFGDEVVCEIKKPRNYDFHKKFYALLNLAFQNQDRYEQFEHLRYVYTLKAGFFEEIVTDKGVVFKPKSISFAKMDDYEFSELYNRMVDVVIKEIGATREMIETELINFL